MEFLDTEFAGNTLQAWLVATAIAVAVFLATSITRALIARYMKRMAGGDELSVWLVLRAMLEALVDAEPLGEIHYKGIPAPVMTYNILSIKGK
jgi:uncharacterized membrane protein YoaK (UPF0700 family)